MVSVVSNRFHSTDYSRKFLSTISANKYGWLNYFTNTEKKKLNKRL